MAIRKRKIHAVNGGSQILGYDYGKYPFHDFLSFAYAGPEAEGQPFKLLCTGNDYWHKECFRQRINSNVFAIEFIQEGTFIFHQFDKTFRVEPGEIFLVHLGANNTMQCENINARKRAITLNGSLLPLILEQLGLNQISKIIPTDSKRILELFDELERCGHEGTLASYRHACSACYELLLELSVQSYAMSRPPELQRALEFIHENLSKQVTLEKLEKHTYVSAATLHRLFRKHLQMSPIEYYLKHKMEMAVSMLNSNLYSVKEVATKMHYSSPQYFASEFKRRYGSSPRELLKKSVPLSP
jgi:AraC-like DNA-binding protein